MWDSNQVNFVLKAANISRAPKSVYLEKNVVKTCVGDLKGKHCAVVKICGRGSEKGPSAYYKQFPGRSIKS